MDNNATWALMAEPGTVRVRVRVRWSCGLCLPDSEGDAEERAVFKVLTVGDNTMIERAVAMDVPVEEGRQETMRTIEPFEFRRLLVRKNLLSWTLDVPIERSGGWLTDGCWERVKSVSAPLMQAFLDGYESHYEITEAEEQKIDRQAAILFSPNSRGVVDACEAVGLFCTLSNTWERYGITHKVDLNDMPYREYILLKTMDAKSAESMRRKTSSASRGPKAKIATARGSRQSRGVIVPD